jgi:hypothetical protein
MTWKSVVHQEVGSCAHPPDLGPVMGCDLERDGGQEHVGKRSKRTKPS